MKWIRISLVLLATLVVSGLSFPHPDDREYKIPEVGTDQRSQYYVLHRDGTFKYGFDTGDGAFESVKSHSPGSRDGKFGYVDDDGNKFKLEYEAGKGGFVAKGDHLPKPSPALVEALAAAGQRSKPFIDPLAGADSDASYGFNFQSDAYSRDEAADSDGTVTGSYSYTDENGALRKFNYRAGEGIGFVIEGDGLTQDPTSVQPQTFRSTPGRTSPSVSRTYGAPARTSPTLQTSKVRGASAPAKDGGVDVPFRRSEIPGDASYSFSYNAGDHSRSESSDPGLNVEGKFSFLADDGNRRTVNYVAGSSTGFQAQGDHLPTDHATTAAAATLRSARPSTKSTKVSWQPSQTVASRPQLKGTRRQELPGSSGSFQPISPAITHRIASYIPPSRAADEADIRSSSSPDGSYSFSYGTSSHSRSESGDANNNVKGEFDFVADDDGKRREIKYEAGSATGFIAEGDHIPVGPEVPGAPSGQPTGRIVPVVEIPFIDPLADSDTDASYKFEFDSDTYSRSESADEDGNVAGTYTVIEDDGTRITNRFRAGKGIGFETEEISRTQGPKPAPRTPYTGPLASDGQTSEAIQPHRQAVSQYSAGTKATAETLFRPPPKTKAAAGTLFRPTPGTFPSGPRASSTVSHKSGHTRTEFPDFTLHSYSPSSTADKFGYVLRFN